MLKASGIYKSYGKLNVLSNVNLSIDNGEIVSIVGPSGAGKTTLLQILGTLEKPDSGNILYYDTDVSLLKDKNLSKFRNKTIGFVFQNHQLLPEFTLLENVMMPALIGGETIKSAKNKAIKLLEEVGLPNRINHKPSQLSGGESQRGAVARALINNPSIILADEPTGSLDTSNRDDLQELFLKLRNSHGCTIVMVTHDILLAKKSDRIIHLVDGKINHEETPE